MKENFIKLLVLLATPLYLLIGVMEWFKEEIAEPIAENINIFIEDMEEDWKDLFKRWKENGKNKKENQK